jgi:TonB family protein
VNRDDSALLAFVLALAASLLVHGPVYAVLGVFADTLLAMGEREPRDPLPPTASEPEWMELVDETTVEEPTTATPSTSTATTEPTPERPREERAERPPARRFREPEEEAAPPPPPPPPVPRPTVPQPDPSLHAIDQRSHDPSVEPPPDTQYVAQENRQVEEETVATERSVQGNQDESANEAPEVELPEEVVNEGNSADDVIAERRAEDGADEGRGVEAGDEARTDGEAGEVRRVAAFGNQRDESATTDRRDERAGATAEAAQRARQEMETVVISDGIGTFTVRRPVAGTGGDAASERAGRVAEGRGAQGEGSGARNRRRLGLGRGRTADGPNLRLSWSDFESVIGEEQLREEREAALAERQSRQRGRHAERTRRWREFRAAIENFVSNVRPGNQTALNARAHPFAAYIGELHRRLHVHYHAFVDNIPADPGHPFNQGQLETTLEIVLRPDGEVDYVGVVRTSGLTLFDFSAWKAVMDAKPYPPAPENIRSVDGNVYVHYTFYRDVRYCHPSNAAPFILSEVPTRRSPPTTGPGTEVAVPQGTRGWQQSVEN